MIEIVPFLANIKSLKPIESLSMDRELSIGAKNVSFREVQAEIFHCKSLSALWEGFEIQSIGKQLFFKRPPITT